MLATQFPRISLLGNRVNRDNSLQGQLLTGRAGALLQNLYLNGFSKQHRRCCILVVRADQSLRVQGFFLVLLDERKGGIAYEAHHHIVHGGRYDGGVDEYLSWPSFSTSQLQWRQRPQVR